MKQVPELVAGRARFHGGRYFKLNVIKLVAPWPQGELNQTIAALDKQGFQVYVHQTGPTSNYASVLDAFEYALKQNGPRDSRHTITHMRASSAPLAARFKALNVRADADWNNAKDWWTAPKAFIETGVPLTLSSDYPIFEASPLAKIAECVKHGIPLEALIDSVTIRGAELEFIEKKPARSPWARRPISWCSTRISSRARPGDFNDKVVLTLFAGKELYRDPSF